MRPRLLVVVTHPMTANILMRGQLSHLVAEGFEVAVAAAPGPDLDAVAEREGVAVFPVPFTRQISPLRDLYALAQMVAVIRRYRPTIVNAGTPKAGLLGMLAARFCRVPVRIYTARGLRLGTTAGAARHLLTFLERQATAASHRIVCVSHSLRRRYIELGLAPVEKVVVLGAGSSNGVDLERFRPALPGEAAALRQQLGIAEHALVVGFVGRWTRDKGIEHLAEVFCSDLVERYPHARLLLVGDWEEGDPISAAVRRSILDDPRIIRPGFVADPAPYYRAMNVLAFPSYREGFPNVPLEAAASGVPVVGYAVTGTVDAVDSPITGTLVPSGDRRGLSRALTESLDDDALRRRQGTDGRRRVEDRFDRVAVWRAWVELYRSILASRHRTPPGPHPRT